MGGKGEERKGGGRRGKGKEKVCSRNFQLLQALQQQQHTVVKCYTQNNQKQKKIKKISAICIAQGSYSVEDA